MVELCFGPATITMSSVMLNNVILLSSDDSLAQMDSKFLIFEKVDFKKSVDNKNHENLPSRQGVKPD